MPIKVLKEMLEIEQSESSMIKASIVENDKGETYLDVRKHVTTEKYTGPTKSGMWLSFETLNKLIDENILTKARDYMEKKASPKKKKDKKNKKDKKGKKS